MKHFEKISHIYFLGIGGIGMSALARFFNKEGKKVLGYDKTETVLTRQLSDEGIAIHYTDLADDIELIGLRPECTLVILTPAVPSSMGERLYFEKSNYRIEKRSRVLGMITDNYKTIAVAGTHGKTTSSSLIAHLLRSSGLDCHAFLGGISANYNSNLLLPELNPASSYCVAEADEYDRSFLQLHPFISIVTSMDADHLDIYGNHQEMMVGYQQFASQVQPGGTLIYKRGLPLDDIEGRKLTYGFDSAADVYADNIRIHHGDYFFDLNYLGRKIENLNLGIPGWHNVENATAAAASMILCGLSEEQLRVGLSSFKGVKRRFEYVVKSPRKIFIDDYAHHPAELRAIIESVKQLYPVRKITGVFQPHLYSRTRDFAKEFAESLDLLDEIILLDVYPARELPIEGINSKLIFDQLNSANKKLCTLQQLPAIIKDTEPEVLVTLGAGDIDTCIDELKKIMQPLVRFDKLKAINDLQKICKGEILINEEMAKYTWLKIGGPADILIKPKNNNDIIAANNYAFDNNIPCFILGNGSNLLVGDKGIRGLVIAVKFAEETLVQDGDEFTVSASYSLPKFVLDTIKLGYQGLEATAGVPATIGGATIMNAGAYGTEMFDCIVRVKVLRNGLIKVLEKSEIEFSYRHTNLKNDVVLETTFKLHKAVNKEELAKRRTELLDKRKDSQPLNRPNTGSVFKNPKPDFAGRLIEEVGMKGYEHGKVQVSPKHANFLVNNGGATAKEFCELVELVKEKVFKEKGIRLHTEVEYVGEFE